MNKQFPLISAALVVMTMSASAPATADTLAQWTFETPPADASNSAIYPNPIAANVGTGNASGVHASPDTDWTTPVGNGSANSFSSNGWTIGDYYQFAVSTTGYSGIQLAWDQTSSNTGPRDFKLSYSTDGSAFSDFATYSVLANGASPNGFWSSTTASAAYGFFYDLSAIAALDNQATAYFRLTDVSTTSATGGTVGTAGTDRIDNFTVSAALIPEASTYGMLLAGLGLVGFMARRRLA